MSIKPRTYFVLILDKSGSMGRTKKQAIAGFNEQIQQIKIDSQDQEIYCCLVTFNKDVFEHLWCVPASELVEAELDEFMPCGGTAMKDAVGYTVQKLLATTDHKDPNTAYLIVTISDGESYDDTHYTEASLKELVSSCESTKKWTFSYIGCTKESLEKLSRTTGTKISNMAAWSNETPELAEVGFKNIRRKQAKYFQERSMGQLASCNYTSTMDSVANFEVEDLNDAPAPVVLNATDLPPVDLRSVLERQPKYTSDTSAAWVAGSPILGTSNKVKWTDKC